MRAEEAFDELVRDGIWPFLEQRGFMRGRFTFHRKAGPNWQLINLQKRASSDASRVTFTRDPAALRAEDGPGSLRWLARLMDLLGEHGARRAVESESARRHAERIARSSPDH